mmetsp:Transcript_1244/g.2531  ORF Transcript_1244/g.2531 Transcript_1244/m.2531 type:complete len:336 (-) Transcript_1244:231-1238(-)
MTKAPTLMPNTGNNLVPITSKVPDQQTRFVHTTVKTKLVGHTNKGSTMSMSSMPKSITSKNSKAGTKTKPKVVKRKPLDVLRTILACPDATSSSSSSSSDGSSSAAQQQTTTSSSTPTSSTPTTPAAKTLTFQKPSEEDIAAYDLETVRAIRGNNLGLLRQLQQTGKSMDACNQFGESVVHMACRRGYADIVEFLLLEVKVRTDRCDDFGRNPFHDALWTPAPNFDVVDLLIDYADPALLLSEDVRGNTPFAYARSNHGEEWISFLEKRKDKLFNRIHGNDKGKIKIDMDIDRDGDNANGDGDANAATAMTTTTTTTTTTTGKAVAGTTPMQVVG